jgi:hypothetical protein
LTQASKLIVLVSLVSALAFETWQGRALYPYLPTLTVIVAAATIVGGRLAPRRTAATVLVLAYWFPVLFVAVTGRPFLPPFFVVWSSALAGLVIGDRGALSWSYPRQWRFALVLWALSVALVWPVIAYREVDFESFALLERYRVSNTGIGGSPSLMVSWTADVAVLHLLGLVWFDWLYRRVAADISDVWRWIALPLAMSATTASALALYQGAVNIGFLSGGVWPSMGRAAGPMLDANTTGMMAAMWSAGVLAFTSDPRTRIAAVVASLVCWFGLWMTGSRSALLAAVIALVPLGLAMIRRAGGFRARRRELTIGAVAVVAVVATLVVAPIRSPLQRLRYMPTFAGDAGVDWLAREMWDRSSYGGAAGHLIARHPFVGIGLGMFHMMGADYIRAHLHSVPPDNAQNWWRHNIVELGGIGAVGLMLWTVLFALFLFRSSGQGDRLIPAAAIKGSLVAIGLASLFGMPAQSLPIAITFWMFAFWYARLVDSSDRVKPVADNASADGADLSSAAWTTMWIVLVAYLGLTLWAGRGDLRVVARAADGGWPYMYGMYEPPVAPAERVRALWTERHGVAVVQVEGSSMILTVRAAHPDISQHPVRAIVKVNGRTVVDTKLYTDVPIVRTIELGTAMQAIIETTVDRTWRSADESAAHPEIGLALSWRFEGHRAGGRQDSAALFSDHRVVEVGEEPVVQPLDVRVDRLRQPRQVAGESGGVDALQTSAVGDRRSKMHVDALEAGGNGQELQRIGMERPDVGDVANVALEERHPARRVDRFENDRRARPQLRVRGFEHADEIFGLEVLNDLER